MSTQNATSAIFAEISGPHQGPGSNLPLLMPFTGLGRIQAQTQFQGPNTALFMGPIMLHEGQTVPFTVFLGTARFNPGPEGWDALRTRLEGRAESGGLGTKCIFIQLTGQQIIWTVTPQQGMITGMAAKRVLEDAVRAELPIADNSQVIAFLSTSPKVPYQSYANNWMQTPSMPWLGGDMRGMGIIGPPDLLTRLGRKLRKLVGIDGPDWASRSGAISPTDGLGDIFSDIAQGATSVSADLLCSPVFQAAAANDIARRYGEDHARTFREAFRQATAYCSPRAVDRMNAARAEEEKRNALLLGGGVVAAGLLLLGVFYFTKKKSNRGQSRRRNIVGPDWRKGRSRRRNSSKLPRWSDKSGWVGGDSRTLYAFTDKLIGKVTVRPGNKSQMRGIGPNATVRVATREEAQRLWGGGNDGQGPLHPGWKVA